MKMINLLHQEIVRQLPSCLIKVCRVKLSQEKRPCYNYLEEAPPLYIKACLETNGFEPLKGQLEERGYPILTENYTRNKTFYRRKKVKYKHIVSPQQYSLMITMHSL